MGKTQVLEVVLEAEVGAMAKAHNLRRTIHPLNYSARLVGLGFSFS